MTVHVLHTDSAEDSEIPRFEGKRVASTSLRVVSATGLDIDDRVLKTDSIIRLVVEARVNGVGHDVDEKTGDLVRVHRAKVLDVAFLPWDPTDPTDIGVAE